MPVVNSFSYEWPEGTTPIEFHAWILTLSEEEQAEFRQAQSKQLAYRQQAVDEGKLELGPNYTYIWKDQEAFDKNKDYDEDWRLFFNRWIRETGVIFKVIATPMEE